MTQSQRRYYPIALIGGGLTTYMIAAVLQHSGYDFIWFSGKERGHVPAPDTRTTTIHHAGRVMLETLGMWPEPDTAWPLTDIFAGMPVRSHSKEDDSSRWPLHWQHRQPPLGYVVSNDQLMRRFEQKMCDQPKLGVEITRLRPGRPNDLCDDAGQHWQADLVIASDGRFSQLRGQAGLKTISQDRGQSAIVTLVTTQKAVNTTAWQQFLATGPLALMATATCQASLVWTLPDRQAAEIAEQDDQQFAATLTAAFGPALGRLTGCGPRHIWPLRPSYVPRITRPGFLVAGDAAHALHPLAGMGYNLALSDGAVLLDCLQQARSRGLDAGHVTVTGAYEQRRRTEIMALTAVTQGLDRLLSRPPGLLSTVAGIGMSVLGRSGLRDRLSHIAMGGVLSPAPLFDGQLRH